MNVEQEEDIQMESNKSPHSEYIEFATRICERAGEGDLEARIAGIDCDDPALNRLFHAINHMLDVADSYTREAAAAMECCSKGEFHRPILLRGLKGAYQDSARKINAAALQMMQSKETIETFEKERRSTASSAQATAEALTHSINDLKQVSHSIGGNSQETLALANSVSEGARDTADNIVGISAACEELSVTTSEITNQTKKAEDLAESTETDVSSFSEIFEEMRASVSKITPVVSLIQRISSQTNLLSLNATIEASRAGEAGKGFAVVANEVKELSKSTALATEKIHEQVKRIDGTTQNAVDAVGSIIKSVSKISEFAKAINTSIYEQSLATDEIAKNVSGVSNAIAQISADIQGVSSSANATNETTATLDEIAQKLAEESQALEAEVSKLLK